MSKTRTRLPRAACAVALVLLPPGAPALAQPAGTSIEQFLSETDEGEIDPREVLEKANEIDLRLSKQIQLLQRQVNQLERRLEELRADAER